MDGLAAAGLLSGKTRRVRAVSPTALCLRGLVEPADLVGRGALCVCALGVAGKRRQKRAEKRDRWVRVIWMVSRKAELPIWASPCPPATARRDGGVSQRQPLGGGESASLSARHGPRIPRHETKRRPFQSTWVANRSDGGKFDRPNTVSHPRFEASAAPPRPCRAADLIRCALPMEAGFSGPSKWIRKPVSSRLAVCVLGVPTSPHWIKQKANKNHQSIGQISPWDWVFFLRFCRLLPAIPVRVCINFPHRPPLHTYSIQPCIWGFGAFFSPIGHRFLNTSDATTMRFCRIIITQEQPWVESFWLSLHNLQVASLSTPCGVSLGRRIPPTICTAVPFRTCRYCRYKINCTHIERTRPTPPSACPYADAAAIPTATPPRVTPSSPSPSPSPSPQL